MSFDEKVVLIIGASSGIGADTARHLAKLGGKVSIVGRNEQRLNEIAEQIRNSGSPNPLPIIADVTIDAQRIVNETIEHFGKLDVLINVAGIYINDNVSTIDMSKFDRVLELNVRSAINMTKLCAPYLEQTKGNIVNVSSLIGIRANPEAISTSVSKAALDQFTKCSALNLASKGIRVNSINPAMIQTRQTDPSDIEEASKYPINRIGKVSETSEAIAFLANDKSASFITGLLLPVDGGCLVAGR